MNKKEITSKRLVAASLIFAAIVIIFLFGFGLIFCSCEQNNEPVTKHTLWLTSVDIEKQNVYMYDINLNKEVTIKYNKDLFKFSLIKLYECAVAHPEFTFYYLNYFYYSI